MPKYSGIVRCSECKGNLRRFKKMKNGKAKYFYYCTNYIKDKTCHKHYITEKELDDAVLNAINMQLHFFKDLPDKIKTIINDPNNDYKIESKFMKLTELEKEIIKYKKMIDDLLIDYKNDYITRDDYDIFSHEYLYKLNKCILEKKELLSKQGKVKTINWISKLEKMKYIDSLDKTLIINLINNIYVDDNKNIEIEFKFNDCFLEVNELLKNQ